MHQTRFANRSESHPDTQACAPTGRQAAFGAMACKSKMRALTLSSGDVELMAEGDILWIGADTTR